MHFPILFLSLCVVQFTQPCNTQMRVAENPISEPKVFISNKESWDFHISLWGIIETLNENGMSQKGYNGLKEESKYRFLLEEVDGALKNKKIKLSTKFLELCHEDADFLLRVEGKISYAFCSTENQTICNLLLEKINSFNKEQQFFAEQVEALEALQSE